MGRSLYDAFPAARDVFEEASDVLHLDMAWLCFEAPEEMLDRPSFTRPAVCTVSVAALRALEGEMDALHPVLVAGHSLGEYTANIAAGVLPFGPTLSSLQLVGQAMERKVGMMAALIGVDRHAATRLCREATTTGLVRPAAFNAPEQVVISGETQAVQRAMELAPQFGAQAVIPLAVGAPCHGPLMAAAEPVLRESLPAARFAPATVPVVSNVGADIHCGGLLARELLVSQLTMPVEWEGSVRTMLDHGVRAAVELGPRPVLGRLFRDQVPQMLVRTVVDASSLLAVAEGRPTSTAFRRAA
jgi:[acyl-carrier-protein] S-malonyltransferase